MMTPPSDSTLLWTALPLGFLGGLHCIGMCGPIVIALARAQGTGWHALAARLLYSLGRTTTYVLLGLLIGALMSSLRMAGVQRWVSIALGGLILLGVLLPTKWTSRLLPGGGVAGPVLALKRAWGRLTHTDALPNQYVIGVLNGLLPCGLVYAAVAASGAMGSPLGSAAFMALFGLGTVPALLATAYAGHIILARFRVTYRRIVPISLAIVAALLILRGLNLGIPYLSPKMVATAAEAPADSSAAAGSDVTFDCCGHE